MKRRFAIAYLITAVVGTLFYLLYRIAPYPVVALFVPTSGSVWECQKLLYWPFLIAALFLSVNMRDKMRAWSAFLAAILVQPLLFAAGYYLLHSGFGIDAAALNIVLYYLVLAAGFMLAFSLYGNGIAEHALGLLIVLASIYGVCLMVFTLAAPNLPIFIPG